jgi:hypothetical protein
MSIQPGVGYTFTSSSQGTNMNIEQPWSEWDATSAAVDAMTQQFQVRSILVGINNKLQIAKGTVNFSQSNMPRVRLGGHYDQRQAWISKVAVYGSGVSRTAGTGSALWMEAGGYYNITTAGTYYVTISKFDISQSNDDTESALLNAETPWVSVFPSGDDIESAIFSETGPSEYVNKTNVHKMVGYDSMSTGLSGDWGNCHTTWFNPTKWGYAVKLIATVTATSVGEGMEFAIDQHIVGPIDLNIPCLFNGTTLCNQDDLNESNDPYNVNKDTTPKAWADIVNSGTLDALEEITPANEDWFQEFVGPADWTSLNYSYLLPSSCAAQDDGDDACFPFKIKDLTTVGTGEGAYVTYKVCPGTLNNLMPQAYDTINEVWQYIDDLASDAELVLNFTAGESWIVLRSGPDPATNDYPQATPDTPADDPYPRIYSQGSDPVGTDTDELAYLVLAKVTEGVGGTFTVDQYVTGSLWADRIKLGTQVAQYYYARI